MRAPLTFGLAAGIACASVNAGLPSAASSGSSASSGPAQPMLAVQTALPRDSVRTIQVPLFEWAAINLALQSPYDTLQLQVIPRTSAGAVIPNPPPVQYTTPDSQAISVSATGLVTAHQPIALAHVIATVIQGTQRFVDTARIQVTQTALPAPLEALSIHPQGGGLTSAHGWVSSGRKSIPFFATIARGNPNARERICSAQGCRNYPLLVHFTSSDPSIANIEDGDEKGVFLPHQPGRVTFTVSTIAYGVRKVDSLPFSIGYNQLNAIEIHLDSTQQPPMLAKGSVKDQFWPPPYGVDLRMWIHNYTDDSIEVSLPAHGLHFVDERMGTEPLPGTRATMRAGGTKVVKVDSAGTYTLTYRDLKRKAILSDTLTVLPYP